MTKKKTITTPDYQEEFLQEYDISLSGLTQEKIDTLIGRLAGKKQEEELLEVINND